MRVERVIGKLKHRIPFGYRVEIKYAIVPNNKKGAASKVKAVFRNYLKLCKITDAADAVGLPVSNTRYILKNEFYCSSDKHKPLISRDMFDRVQMLLNTRHTSTCGKRYPESLKKKVLKKVLKGKSHKEACEEVGLHSKGYNSAIPSPTIQRWVKQAKGE